MKFNQSFGEFLASKTNKGALIYLVAALAAHWGDPAAMLQDVGVFLTAIGFRDAVHGL